MAGIFYSIPPLPSITLHYFTLRPFDLSLRGTPIVGREIVHKELKLCRNHHGYYFWVYAPAAPRLRHPQNPLSGATWAGGKTVEQIVDTIDQTPQSRPLPYSASITSTELKLSDGEQIYTLPLGDKFYLFCAL